MKDKLYEDGLAVRREVLGSEYVDRALSTSNDFNADFQKLVTELAWGLCWTDDRLSRRERSILNLGMLAALGRMTEFGLHLRGALNNGISEEELKAILTQITIYAGMPAGVECFRIARQILDQQEAGS